MAVLGAELVITMAAACVLQRVSPHVSAGRWLLSGTGLRRFLSPSDSELRTLAGVPARTKKGADSSDTFLVPRNLELRLESAPIGFLDLASLRYFNDYRWLLDFALHAVGVVLISEIFQFSTSHTEPRLSVLWCLLVVAFAFKMLGELALQYFRGDESTGERSVLMVAASAYLVVSMIILVQDEKRLELGLEQAYTSFQEGAAAWLNNHGISSTGPASKLMIKLSLAVWCAFTGALFVFPGLRMARMHDDALKYCEERPFMRAVLKISFVAPLLLVALWIRPICRDVLVPKHLSEAGFESVRLWSVVGCVLLRLVLMPVYLQAYLNLASSRLEQEQKQAGRISNRQLQQQISAVFRYLCVVALQFVSPLLLVLFFTMLFKILGGLSWSGIELECSATEAVEGLSLVFTPDVFRGLFGFATWWCIFTWFSSLCLGSAYVSYFGQS